MTLIASVILGVASSLAASTVWLFAIRSIRPKIGISPTIAEEIDFDGKPQYRIKFVNQTRRAVVDLSFELALVTPTAAKGGAVKRLRLLAVTNAPLLVPGISRHNDDDNAFRVRTNYGLPAALREEQLRYIRLRIFARDEVSGIGRLFESQYHDPDSEIVRGHFSKGQLFEIVPTREPASSAG